MKEPDFEVLTEVVIVFGAEASDASKQKILQLAKTAFGELEMDDAVGGTLIRFDRGRRVLQATLGEFKHSAGLVEGVLGIEVRRLNGPKTVATQDLH